MFNRYFIGPILLAVLALAVTVGGAIVLSAGVDVEDVKAPAVAASLALPAAKARHGLDRPSPSLSHGAVMRMAVSAAAREGSEVERAVHSLLAPSSD